MSLGRPRRVAGWLALCLIVPLVAGTGSAPGSFQSEATHSCSDIPCLLWTGRHEGPMGEAAAHHLALSPDGETAYVVGGTATVETLTDLVTWALDVATGELLWSTVYDGGHGESQLLFHDVRAITVSPDGARVAVAGTSGGGFGHSDDIVTITYDAATGQELWADRFNGPDGGKDTATGIAVDRTGTYIVTVGSVVDRDDHWEGILIGHDLATGARLWQRPFAGACGDSDVLGIKTTPASPAIFVGGLRSTCLSNSVEETPQEVDLAFTPTIWAVDPATGGLLWEAQDDDLLLTMQSAMFLGALEATEENVVLSSRITNPRNPDADLDVLTMAVDLQGQALWHNRYDSLGNDDLLGMRAEPDGSRVYIVATSPALGAAGRADQNRDIVVTALDGQTGAVDWSTRLDSSTTGATFEGRNLGGEGDDDAFLSVPALLENGTRLAFGYTAWIESPVPIVGPLGPNGHVLAVLDTSDGSVSALRMDPADLQEYSYESLYDRADLVGVGSIDGEDFSRTATFRRLSLDVTPPDLDLPGDLLLEAMSPDGATVTFEASANDDRDGSVPVACTPASGSTFPLGSSTVSCAAADSYGNVAFGSFQIRVEDTTPPTLHIPADVAAAATSTGGSVVDYTAFATDLVDGDVAISCSHASGSTFSPGVTQVNCEAVDAAGNTASAAFDVVVTYEWTGFQDPVQADGSSTFQQGRTVPVKIQLAGASAPVEDAAFRLWTQREGGVEMPAVGRATSGNALEYDEATGTYQFQWNTGTVLPGLHRLRLDLGDGSWNVVTVRIT